MLFLQLGVGTEDSCRAKLHILAVVFHMLSFAFSSCRFYSCKGLQRNAPSVAGLSFMLTMLPKVEQENEYRDCFRKEDVATVVTLAKPGPTTAAQPLEASIPIRLLSNPTPPRPETLHPKPPDAGKNCIRGAGLIPGAPSQAQLAWPSEANSAESRAPTLQRSVPSTKVVRDPLRSFGCLPGGFRQKVHRS